MLKTFLYFGLGLGSNYFFNIFLARNLGSDLFGQYSLGITLFTITSLLSACGLDQAAVRFIPQALTRSQKNAKQYKKAIILIGLITSAAGSLILAGLALQFRDSTTRQVLLLLSLSVVPSVLLTILLAILQAQHIVTHRLTIKYIVEPATKILVSLSLIYFGLNIASPIVGMLAAFTISTFVVVVWKWRFINFQIPQLPIVQLTNESLLTLRSFCWPLIASSLFTIAAGRADILIIGATLTASSVAYYSAALQTSGILAIVLQAAETVSTSRFSTALARHDTDELCNEFQKITRWSSLIGLPVFLAFYANAGTIMQWFGQDFVAAKYAFQILCASQLINLLTGPANPILIMAGRTKLVMRNDIIYGLTVVAAVYFGTATFGLTGAALAAAFVSASLNFYRTWSIYQLFNFHPYSRYYLKPALSLLTCLIIYSYLGNRLGVLGFIVYPLLCMVIVLLLGLHSNDRQLFISALDGFKSKWKKS